LGRQIQQELTINNTSLGLLSGYYFILTYSIASFLLGYLADRFAPQRIISFGLLLWGGSTLFSGLAANFHSLVIARLLFGIGQAALTPAALTMIRQVCAAEKLAIATGVYYAGLSIGGGASLLISGWLEPKLGWRGCFGGLGALTLCLAIPVLLYPTKSRRKKESSENAKGDSSILSILSSPGILFAIAGSVCIVFMSAAGNLRMVWLQAERGFGINIGVVAGLIYMSGGLLGNVVGGALGDYIERKRDGGRLRFIAWAQLLLSPIVLLSYWLDSPNTIIFYLCWFFAIMATTIYYGPAYSAIQQMAPEGLRATATGLLILAVNLVGVGGGPLLAGYISDHSTLTMGLIVSSCSSFLAFPLFLLAAQSQRKKGLKQSSRP